MNISRTVCMLEFVFPELVLLLSNLCFHVCQWLMDLNVQLSVDPTLGSLVLLY